MDTATSVHGIPIRLSDERWAHIVESHDDLAGYRDMVLQVIDTPDKIYKGHEGAFVAVKKVGPNRNLCVVYRESAGDGFIITAYFSSKRAKGKVVWPV